MPAGWHRRPAAGRASPCCTCNGCALSMWLTWAGWATAHAQLGGNGSVAVVGVGRREWRVDDLGHWHIAAGQCPPSAGFQRRSLRWYGGQLVGGARLQRPRARPLRRRSVGSALAFACTAGRRAEWARVRGRGRTASPAAGAGAREEGLDAARNVPSSLLGGGGCGRVGRTAAAKCRGHQPSTIGSMPHRWKLSHTHACVCLGRGAATG